jgi:hypothetical protein
MYFDFAKQRDVFDQLTQEIFAAYDQTTDPVLKSLIGMLRGVLYAAYLMIDQVVNPQQYQKDISQLVAQVLNSGTKHIGIGLLYSGSDPGEFKGEYPNQLSQREWNWEDILEFRRLLSEVDSDFTKFLPYGSEVENHEVVSSVRWLLYGVIIIIGLAKHNRTNMPSTTYSNFLAEVINTAPLFNEWEIVALERTE